MFSVKFIPHDYQSYCIDYIKTHPVSALLLDMGLGKTVTKSSQAPDYRKLVDSVFKRIGKDRLGYNYKKFNIRVLVSRQSKDIAQGVDKGGAGDQGIVMNTVWRFIAASRHGEKDKRTIT